MGNLRRLGDQGTWAPIAALFVFTAGRANTLQYVVGYLSQLALGAMVGLIVNSVVFPPLALHEVERSTRAVRRDIIGVLDTVVELLQADEGSTDERAAEVRTALGTLPDTRQRLGRATAQAQRAQHGNARRKRWQGSHADVLALAAASESAVSVVEDLAREMLEDRAPLRRPETSAVASAARSLRDVLAQSREGVPDQDLVRRTEDLLDDAAIEGAPFVVQRAVAGLRRCMRIATGWTE